MRHIAVGALHVPNGTIDITDPCYDHDVWCRINNFKILPGKYKCFYNNNIEGRVTESYIIHCEHTDTLNRWRKTDYSIGVDAGLAGFFISPKPNYSNEAWQLFCNALEQGSVIKLSEQGFFTSSGYGDGEYEVRVKIFEKKVVAVKLVFL